MGLNGLGDLGSLGDIGGIGRLNNSTIKPKQTGILREWIIFYNFADEYNKVCMKIFRKLLICMVILFSSCGGGERHIAMLDEIDRLCDSDPRAAMARLDSIDRDALSEKERHYHDLLFIKSRDKAYVRHTSDSLILDVIDYYTSHNKDPHYPEALYYGGRVYSDIGDLPTALKYFQDALDAIPEDQKNLRFKGNVLSQTGRLLEDLRLYSQATPYIERSIEISRQLKDSADVFYDYMQLILLNINTDSLNIARKYIHDNYNYVNSVDRKDSIWFEASRASVMLYEGKVDSALDVVRPLVNSTDSLCRNYVLSIAAKIYMASGIPDTTYIYARELASGSNFNNKISGFNTLFSEEVYPMIPKDSLSYFVRDYGEQMNEHLNLYESEEALLQNSRYNYQIHLRERETALKDKLKAQKDRDRLLFMSIVVIATLVITIFVIKYNLLKTEIKLRMAVSLVKTMEYRFRINQCDNDHYTGERADYAQIGFTAYPEETYILSSPQERLRKELMEGLQFMSDRDHPDISISEGLKHSSVVKKLHKMVSEGMGMKDNDTNLWNDVEKAVHKVSPEFKTRLLTLSLGKMSEKEYRVALLTRCGFRPKDISSLLIKGKSTATDRRRSLAKKIFGASGDNDDLDRIISII
ncbi:MAG: hypothetical protein K2G13_01890 [Muribaculaceae bacterium]|nr:hypothetical protein [Muribaculaceae bacterium]